MTNKYGCYNAEPVGHYYVKEREYKIDGTYIMVDRMIVDVMSKRCEWSKEHTSTRCEGCKWQLTR